jgi:hypothetical protein
MGGLLNFLWAVCVGTVALFAFFLVMGGFAPGDVLWLTAIVAFLGTLFVVHQIRVGHELNDHEDHTMVREVQRIRERRGF